MYNSTKRAVRSDRAAVRGQPDPATKALLLDGLETGVNILRDLFDRGDFSAIYAEAQPDSLLFLIEETTEDDRADTRVAAQPVRRFRTREGDRAEQ